MRVPQSPPKLEDCLHRWGAAATERLIQMLQRNQGPCDAKGRYVHWDKLRHLDPPEGFDTEMYWLSIRRARQNISRNLPFKDKHGQPFTFCMPDGVIRDLLWIEKNTTGAIEADPRITDPQTRQTYLINTLMEESISSSQLEGAATTRRVAKEMIRTGREPADNSERMIINNYRAMQFIGEHRDDALTPAMVFELHRILTEGTLRDQDRHKAGAFRSPEDEICVFGHDDVLLHEPPAAQELPFRMAKLCEFANAPSEGESGYIPAVIRGIIVHFMIGYDHPFVDGNGRTARALFYWVMVRERYWLMEYLSLSRVIKKAPSRYLTAYLHTETDDNDTTYFVIHQLAAIREAVDDLHEHLAAKAGEQRDLEAVLANSSLLDVLNHRQISLLQNALNNPGAEYTIRSHQLSHGVSYQTARTDLHALSDDFQILKKYRLGRAEVFIAPPDLQGMIRRASG